MIISLNPFEVREVLQVIKLLASWVLVSLNPFEVREVLQVRPRNGGAVSFVSIPLKSGRCCKGALQNLLIKINKLFVNFR